MNRRKADLMAVLFILIIIIFGLILSLQAFQQEQSFNHMMGTMMDPSPGTVQVLNPLWYVLGTILVSAAFSGLYLAVRDSLTVKNATDHSRSGPSDLTTPESDTSECSGSNPELQTNPDKQPNGRMLDILPEDEKRILEPVLVSPGITQIQLRDQSDFSKSKVSQTVTALEKRGLLYRERQGRTYRVYPSDELRQN